MIENSNFLLKKVPEFSPFDANRLIWWKHHKGLCIEGAWAGGKWMPPNLYFYVNFWHIMLNETTHSKTKKLLRPFLRDLEWTKSYLYQEARGFSGFIKDTKYTCKVDFANADLLLYDKENKEFIEGNEELRKELNSTRRYDKAAYLTPRQYLPKLHSGDLGYPLYENQAKNIVDIEARGGGKSFYAASNIGWNFLMDGATNYEDYFKSMQNKSPLASETLVGAIDYKFSGDLIKKVALGLDNMAGSTVMNGILYPSPMYKSTIGSLAPGKALIAAKEVKTDGHWSVKGSKSLIHHRTFKDNHLAGNGTRPNLSYLEEVGFMGNLVEALGAMKECTMNGDYKFGTIWMMGTGGDMEGGSTHAVKQVFHDPEAYDCLVFDDEWENTGKIGYFVPAHLTLNKYKDSEGVTDVAAAKASVDKIRAKLAKGKDKQAYNDELQNKPEKPSEAFLTTKGNIFPIADLKAHLQYLESDTTGELDGIKGEVLVDSATGKVRFEPNDKLQEAGYPIKKGEQKPGCVVIYEPPMEGVIPFGMYIAATDPYDQDQAPNSNSVGSTFIYKTFQVDGTPCDMIVAEYSGRPSTAREHHETVRRLLLLYNCRDLYENERNTMKWHFETSGSVYLLADTPTILKATENSKTLGARNVGIHMTDNIKEELEIYARDWLNESRGNGILNLHTIKSKNLLRELIDYNADGNFDRVIAFLLLILHKMTNHRIKIDTKKQEVIDSFFKEALFTNRNTSNLIYN